MTFKTGRKGFLLSFFVICFFVISGVGVCATVAPEDVLIYDRAKNARDGNGNPVTDISGKNWAYVVYADTQNVKSAGFPCASFSVGANKKVMFSPGNLQYDMGTDTWHFADHQWDYVGDDNKNINNSSYNGRIDLFSWGTGSNPTLYDATSASFTDWGVNAIDGGMPNEWRTLSAGEWGYLFFHRPDADHLFGLGNVNGVNGLILCPDQWSTPAGVVFYSGADKGFVYNITTGGDTIYKESSLGIDHFSDNVYGASDWLVMESAGAIFLPAAGARTYYSSVVDVYGVGSDLNYQSSTPDGSDYCKALYGAQYSYWDISPMHQLYKRYGYAVRLVRDK